MNQNQIIYKRAGNGIMVLNKHLKWTPILDFAQTFQKAFAEATARNLRADTMSPEALAARQANQP